MPTQFATAWIPSRRGSQSSVRWSRVKSTATQRSPGERAISRTPQSTSCPASFSAATRQRPRNPLAPTMNTLIESRLLCVEPLGAQAAPELFQIRYQLEHDYSAQYCQNITYWQ